jgi:putative ABC transport system permease protein
MILFQSGFAGLVGYGFGVGLYALVIEGARFRMPDYAAVITFPILLLAFGRMSVIAGASSFIAARRVLSIDPIDIFSA